MHPNDLIQFRDKVAIPCMMQLFEKTHIEDGTCFIDNLEIALLDGRGCGFDNHVCASGLLYRSGVVEEYSFDECDVELSDFFAEHKGCIFISDGALRVSDELDELDLHTCIRNIKSCGRFFSWFSVPSEMNIEMVSGQYEKMKHLLAEQKVSERSDLDSLVNAAAAMKVADNNTVGPEWEPDR